MLTYKTILKFKQFLWRLWDSCFGKPYILTSDSVVVCTTQSAAQFGWELLVTASAGRAFVIFVEFTSGTQRCITHGAGKVVYTPCFVQCRENCYIEKYIKLSQYIRLKSLTTGYIGTYHHQQWLGCTHSTSFQTVDGNAARSRQGPSSRNGDDHGMASHIWHIQSAKTQTNNVG